MVACFFLKQGTLKKVSTKKLKEMARDFKVLHKDADKESIAVLLGKHLFEKELVVLTLNVLIKFQVVRTFTYIFFVTFTYFIVTYCYKYIFY